MSLTFKYRKTYLTTLDVP